MDRHCHGTWLVDDVFGVPEIHYKTTDYYRPEYERGLCWDDPHLNITWPFKMKTFISPRLSKKDSSCPDLHMAEVFEC